MHDCCGCTWHALFAAGGFKLWECAIDLAAHLRHLQQSGKFQLTGKRVMELGCGHGLPGIVALLAGAEVHFQVCSAIKLASHTCLLTHLQNAWHILVTAHWACRVLEVLCMQC